eukprot:m.131337 g.131337  ORF g.131337 m.131337 type:complete len:317 (+) comp29538_c0_seq1:422-1372(+)
MLRAWKVLLPIWIVGCLGILLLLWKTDTSHDAHARRFALEDVDTHVPPPPQQTCLSADECPADHACIGECHTTGVCMTLPSACNKSPKQFCGCDGKFFTVASNCVNQRIAVDGRCDPTTTKPEVICDPITDPDVIKERNLKVARFHTTKGDFDVQLRPDLALRGVIHIMEMVESGYFEQISFFRVNQWITQFGCDERDARPQFDKLRVFTDKDKDTNPCGDKRWSKGTFAVLGGNQNLIVINPNDQMGKNELDAPAGYVVAGMQVVESLFRYNDPIDHPEDGPGPDQTKISQPGGAKYLKDNFPKLDYILSAEIIQ